MVLNLELVGDKIRKHRESFEQSVQRWCFP